MCVCVCWRGVEGRHEDSPEKGLHIKEQKYSFKEWPCTKKEDKNKNRITSLEIIPTSQRIDSQSLFQFVTGEVGSLRVPYTVNDCGCH